VHVAFAQEPFRETNLDMERVAEQAGFSSPRQLRRAWQKVHMTPPRGESEAKFLATRNSGNYKSFDMIYKTLCSAPHLKWSGRFAHYKSDVHKMDWIKELVTSSGVSLHRFDDPQ